MATIFRPPFFTRIPRRDSTAAVASPTNDSNNTLPLLVGKDKFFGAPGQGPNYNWPNPVLRVFTAGSAIASQLGVWQDRLVTLLRSKDQFFTSAGDGPSYDWPNPTLAKSSAAALVAQPGVTENRNLNLLAGKDTFFGPAGLGPNYRWDNPSRVDTGRYTAAYAQSNVWANLLGTLLAVTTVAAPFGLDDWSTPRAAPSRAAYSFDAPNLLGTTLAPAGPVSRGGGSVAPAVLSRSAAISAQGDVTQDLLGTTLAPTPTAAPFSLDDWPVPRPHARRHAWTFDPPNLTALYNTVVVPLPPVWGNPSAALNRAAYWTDAPNLVLRQPAPSAPPFRQLDWSTPRGGLSPAAYSFSAPNLIGAGYASGAPFGLSDWPNPQTSRRPVPFDPPNCLVTTVAVQAAPFAQYDWRNPSRLRFQPSADTPDLLATLLAVAAPPAPPFALYDWPTPRRAACQLVFMPPNLTGGLAPPPPPAVPGESFHFGRDSIF